jgi:hypothetical protein
MSNEPALPVYQSHKRVRAGKIAAIEHLENGEDSCILLKFEGGFAPVTLLRSWFFRHNPKIGGYFVVYADGYTSWSPAEAFEEGYARVNEGERDTLQQARAYHARQHGHTGAAEQV